MAEKELKLLDGVEFHLALAETDIKLENVLKIYLCPTLLKLASPHEIVRKKVIQICNHIRIRIKSNENIKLPIDTLLEQFRSKNVENSIKRFTLLFLDMAFFRLNDENKKKMLSKFIPELLTYSIEYKKTIVYLILYILGLYGDFHKELTDEFENDESLKEIFNSGIFLKDFAFLAQIFKDLSLFSLSYFHSLSRKLSEAGISEPLPLNCFNHINSSADIANISLQLSVLKKTCPGLSFDSLTFLTPKGKDTFNIDLLNRIKIGVIRFLSTSYFSLDQKFVTLTIFKFDIDHNISSVADICLKKLSVIDLEDEKVIENIYDLLLGESETLETMQRSPVSPQIYVHLMSFLSKSHLAVKNIENIPKLLNYGLQSTVQKLVETTITFIHWIARTLNDDTLKPIFQFILRSIMTYIQNSDCKNEVLRQHLFTSIGLIAKRGMDQMEISVLKFLFDSLENETKSVRLSIEQSLSLIMPCFQNIQGNLRDQLDSLLFQIITSNHINTHFSALRYCLTVFPFHESKARMLCLLCLREDCKLEVIEEAKKGLNPYWFLVTSQMKGLKHASNITFSKNDNNFFFFPVFEDFIEVLENQKVNHEGDNFFIRYLGSHACNIINHMVKFTRQTLIMNLLQSDKHIQNLIPLSKAWEEQLDIAMNNNDKFRTAYKKSFDIAWSSNSKFKKYLTNYFQYLVKKFFETPSEFAHNVLELLSLGHVDLTIMLIDRIDLFQTLVLSSKEDIEYDIYHIFGIIGSHPNVSNGKVMELLILFIDNQTFQTNQQFISRHASILSLGYLLSRLNCRGRLAAFDLGLLYKCYDFVVEKIFSNNRFEKIAAFVALGELSIFNVLLDLKALEGHKFTSLVMTILDLHRESKSDIKLQEIIIITLGKMAAVMDPKQDGINFILNYIFENHYSEQAYSYFTDGEVLSCIASGWKSKYLYKFVDMSISGIPEIFRSEHMDFILKKILEEYITSTKLSLKKASVIWLLSLIQYCDESLSIQSNILNIQSAFISLLSDKDMNILGFVQESVSKGLKLLYEKCREEAKSSLVQNLISCLITDKKNHRTISSDTVLFNHEILNTNSASISTYGDVCKLATEVGNPELIYQFLNIASNSAIWQSRKGVAFTINEIISSNPKINIIENDPELVKKLIPCLFLYKFHPISTIKKTMENIFKTLVPEKISQFHADIINRLLKGISDQSWYIREASCNALADLLQTQAVENIQSYLEDIIIMGFRAIDDIKENVRIAALNLCRFIASFIIKNINFKDNEKNTILEKSIPIFLKKVISDVPEAKTYALNTLIKICNIGKSSLKPFIPELVDNFLNFLTELEPQIMNYLELNVDKYDITQEQLNDIRIFSLRTSPILNAIEDCMDQLDQDITPKIITVILNNMLRAVGLPTKLACSRLIVNIILRKADYISPYANDIFKTFQASLFDRNHTARISFSASLGYIARIVSTKDLILLNSNLKKKYFEEEDENNLITIASVYKYISTHANEKFALLFSVFLPIVFLGKHDQFESVRSQFNETWSENTGNSSSITLYLDEIFDIIISGLENNRWRLKKISAVALIEVIKVSEVNKYLDKLVPLLMNILQGKLWEGKETVLDAFITLSCYNKNYVLNKEGLVKEIFDILIRETKRNDNNYRCCVLHNFNRFIEFYSNFESFENIYSVIEKFISINPEEMEIYKNDENSKSIGSSLREYSLRIIANLFSTESDKTYIHYLELVRIWKENMQLAMWNIQMIICESIQKIFKKKFLNIILFDQLKNSSTLLDNWNIIFYALNNKKHESVRKEAVKATKIFIESLRDFNDPDLKRKIFTDFNEFILIETSPMIKTELEHIDLLHYQYINYIHIIDYMGMSVANNAFVRRLFVKD
ncbi:hypothetical protein PCANB_002731 [Pneumocystis canis]|nr:hypothetical protein PCANB_002731 [Pneumocystis canis]